MKGKAKWSILLSLLLVFSLVLAACSSSGSSSDKKDKNTKTSSNDNYKQVMNLAETEEIPTMNTTIADDQVSFIVFNQVYEGLYTMNEKDELVPALAVGDPQIEKQGSDYVYTFKLQPNAKWSNGDPVTANDFVYAWQKVVDPKTKGASYNYLFPTLGIKNAQEIIDGKMPPDQLGVKAVDDHTLEVTLTKEVPYYKSLFAFPTFFPQNKKFVESQGKNYGLEVENCVFNGPYVLDSWDHNEGWVYKKNPTYWDKDNVHIDQINVKVVKDLQARINLYMGGKIDAVGLSKNWVAKYSDRDDFRKKLGTSVYYFKFNEKNKYLKNPNIRKAISMGWDRQAYVDKLLNNGSVVATGLIPGGFVKTADGKDFREANGDLQNYDLEKAKEYWQKGLDELGVKNVELEILAYDGPDYKQNITYIANQLQKNLPGLKLKINQQEFKVMLDLEDNLKYDIATAGWGPDYQDPMTFLDMFTTGNGNNQMAYSNPEYDKLIKEAGEKADDPAARDQLLLQAEKILIQDDAALGLMYQSGGASLVQPYLVNFASHPFGPDYSFKFMSVKKH